MTGALRDGIFKILEEAGRGSDAAIDPALTALKLAELNHPGVLLERYENFLTRNGTEVAERHRALLEAGSQDDAPSRLAALKHVLVDSREIVIPSDHPDILEQSDLMRVIDTGQAGSVTLGILYLDAARRNGWDAEALQFPGAFLLRLDADGNRLIFDPAQGCRVLQAADLRSMLKRQGGPEAELSATYYEPLSNREILVRLQNPVKLRLIQMEDYEGALAVVETLRLIDPAETRLLLDAGVLYNRTGRLDQAEKALMEYADCAPSERDRQDALMLLRHVRNAKAGLPKGETRLF